MRMVIDLQGAQSQSSIRGIGGYSLSLAQAITRNSGEHEIFIALSGLFPDSINPIRAAFFDLLPQERIRVWHSPGPVEQICSDNTWRRQAAELVREAFLANLKPDIVLVCSLFEGFTDNTVTSLGILSSEIPTVVILHDLIPLIHRTLYLEDPTVSEWYDSKIGHLRRASFLLANSDSSRLEGINFIDFPADQTITISAGAAVQFCQKEYTDKQRLELMQRYGLSGHYVLYTGGIGHRKNIEGLIRAYASLPVSLRKQHQLVVVCSVQDADRARLDLLAKEAGLAKAELILTDFVPDEDLVGLYNLCKVLVFPSKHEGFGLPVLEAMCCGRAVIGSNTSSLPEVIGYEEALFDPYDDASIKAKLEQVLVDRNFRQKLEQHALVQAKKFSWNKSAQLALAACEKLNTDLLKTKRQVNTPAQRPRLAYISPLPPERSGISCYSAELLPELARHYEIDVVVEQDSISNSWIKANCQVRTVDWFKAHAESYHRVLYHFGNSDFHQHMFELLEQFPGTVVLHDFFFSGIVAHMDVHGYKPNYWASMLYHSHGYTAVQHRNTAKDSADVVLKYPCNFNVLKNAQGVIVHSEYSRRLAHFWYGQNVGNEWVCIPHLRTRAFNIDKNGARKSLGLAESDFVVCSFGYLSPTKLNHRLFDVFIHSALANDDRCKLVFVGDNNNSGEYGHELSKKIREYGLEKRIRITGWTDTELYRQYLAAADVSVQLRAQSRGETSGTVLDCMKYGLPTIVNAHGSFADLSDEAVLKLADEFRDDELASALELLWKDCRQRQQLGEFAQQVICSSHAPRTCADQYFKAIETFSRNATTEIPSLIKKISRLESPPNDARQMIRLAQSIGQSIPATLTQKQLLVDISGLAQRDIKTGIQCVVRSILLQLLIHPPRGIRVEPVYATVERGYCYAHSFTTEFLNCSVDGLTDAPVDYQPGDIFLGLDFQPEIMLVHKEFYRKLRRYGVKVLFVVYDLLSSSMAKNFGIEGMEFQERWLHLVSESNGAVCISKTVADQYKAWLEKHDCNKFPPFGVYWFHLGVDIDCSVPSFGMPDDSNELLSQIGKKISFLMVGTVEPRKGHLLVMTAFEQLWSEGFDVHLVIVGQQGWNVEELIKRVSKHSERGKRLFWLDAISDEYLKKIYNASDCLIAASEGEGFGQPLIEASKCNLAIFARNIPVFQEIAGKHAYYFKENEAAGLAKEVKDWIKLYKNNKAPQSNEMPWLTWTRSVEMLLEVVCKAGFKQ